MHIHTNVQSPDRPRDRSKWCIQVTRSNESSTSPPKAAGCRPPTIVKELVKESLKCWRVGVYKVLRNYNATGSIGRRGGSGRPSNITADIKEIVE